MNATNRSQFDIKPIKNDKPRVLIDLDGVVRDFIGSLITVYKKIYPSHTILPVNSRRLEDFFPIQSEIYKFMEAGHIEEIMENAPPYPGAVQAMQRWQNEFEIIVVSAQPEISKFSTYIWVGKHQIPTNEVHITYNKSEIEGIALLDDFVDNLEEFAATNRFAVCLDQPWNQSWKGERVKSVEDFFKIVYARFKK
jgi:5'(3')-deoxyribonucleotidase